MSLRNRIERLLCGDKISEYQRRFLRPQIERLEALSISERDMKHLFDVAVKRGNPEILGLTPSSLFRDMVDRIAAGDTVEQVIATFAMRGDGDDGNKTCW